MRVSFYRSIKLAYDEKKKKGWIWGCIKASLIYRTIKHDILFDEEFYGRRTVNIRNRQIWSEAHSVNSIGRDNGHDRKNSCFSTQSIGQLIWIQEVRNPFCHHGLPPVIIRSIFSLKDFDFSETNNWSWSTRLFRSWHFSFDLQILKQSHMSGCSFYIGKKIATVIRRVFKEEKVELRNVDR